PPKSDGALLFLQTMLAKRKPPEEGGSRIAIIFNGSPLFSGGAGSGPSNIRKWILDNDWLEAIVALPEQLFYNTGIATYVWVLTNNKVPERGGTVQLIDARDLWEPMPKSLGDKRRRLGDEHLDEVIRLYQGFEEGERSKFRENEFFMYRRVAVERPLRLRYEVDDDAVERLKASKAFQRLALPAANVKDLEAATAHGERAQAALIDSFEARRSFATTDRDEAEKVVTEVLRLIEKPTAPLRQALLSAFSHRDPEAPPTVNRRGQLLPDPTLRDYDNVPLRDSVEKYVEHEILPFAPDAWIDDANEIGAEIHLTRLFYRYESPRSLDEIDAEIRVLERQIARLTDAVAG
ncbi:MAG: SAM-dependent methyltransferase, partial [Actinobacteria bacterium]|nr:SAM-dependent methyltransferase [Actinomycetota bacterium]